MDKTINSKQLLLLKSKIFKENPTQLCSDTHFQKPISHPPTSPSQCTVFTTFYQQSRDKIIPHLYLM